VGLDISPRAIEFAWQLVRDEGLSDRNPRLFVSKKDLKFEEFRGETFDYLFAQSVFTHLKAEHIAECFEHIRNVMTDASRFYFTYRKTEAPRQIGMKSFGYPFAAFESLASQNGFELEDCSAEYAHPTGQTMLKLRILRASRPEARSPAQSPIAR
jgi:cyclopropane fatty-acyl-phospholipid synthase-like methyltransferase